VEQAPALLSAASASAAWRLLLLSDGSLTRHLHALCGGEPRVELLREAALCAGEDGGAACWWAEDGRAPASALPSPPLLLREVLLHPPGNDPGRSSPLVYAASWWNAGRYGAAMRERGAPIWRNLAQRRTEAFRELRSLSLARPPPPLAARLGLGPGERAWGRHYVLHASGEPLCLVFEAFNPSAVAALLGCDADGRAAAAAAAAAGFDPGRS